MNEAMIVGDDASTRRMATDVLKAHRYKVMAIDSGADVVGVVKAQKPRVMVVEVKRPHAGASLKLMKQVRKESPSLPILVMAETGLGTTLEKALELGNVDYVKAPFERFEFDHRLPLLVARSDQQSEGAEASSGQRSAPVVMTLHDPETGRLDARRIADYLGVRLTQLASAVGKRYQTVHKSPAAASLQSLLSPIAHIVELLETMLGDPGMVRAWLNRPHPNLGKRQPLAVILEGHVSAVETILENALQGIPS